MLEFPPFYKLGILGETSKFSPISPQRIRSAAITSDRTELKINFYPFKEDNFQFYVHRGDKNVDPEQGVVDGIINIGKSCDAEEEIKMLTISFKDGDFNFTCSEFGFSECSKGPCPIPCSEKCPTGACTQADPCDSRNGFEFYRNRKDLEN